MGVLMRCAFLLLLACLPARAEPRPESRWGLRWYAPAECIQAAALARGVEARLGRAVFGPDPEFLIDGLLVRGQPEGWTATLTLVDMRGNVLGSRTVSSPRPDCALLEPRLLLVLSLMIDPTSALSGPPPEASAPPPPEPVAPEPVAPEPVAPEPVAPELIAPEPAPAVSPPEKDRSALTLAATGSAGHGFGLTPGGAWTIWWGPGQGVLTRFAFAPYESLSKDGGQVWLLSTMVEGGVCPFTRSGAAGRVSGCASASLSLLSASNESVQPNRHEFLLRSDVGPRLRLEVNLSRGVALHLGLGAGWGWLRPTARLFKPDGSAEDLPVGLPVHASVDLGVSLLEL